MQLWSFAVELMPVSCATLSEHGWTGTKQPRISTEVVFLLSSAPGTLMLTLTQPSGLQGIDARPPSRSSLHHFTPPSSSPEPAVSSLSLESEVFSGLSNWPLLAWSVIRHVNHPSSFGLVVSKVVILQTSMQFPGTEKKIQSRVPEQRSSGDPR